MSSTKDTGFGNFPEMIKQRDGGLDGRFYLGVKTTKIFCLPSCRARAPLPENITIFFTREEAMKAGYRGCKRCRSASFPDIGPEWLPKVEEYLRNNIHRKIQEYELVSIAGVNITTIRRYFRRTYGKPIMNYHKALRLRNSMET